MNILSGKLLSFTGSTESSDKECQEGAHFMNFSFQVVKCELQDVKCELQVVECAFQDLKHKNDKDENEIQNAFFAKIFGSFKDIAYLWAVRIKTSKCLKHLYYITSIINLTI